MLKDRMAMPLKAKEFGRRTVVTKDLATDRVSPDQPLHKINPKVAVEAAVETRATPL